MFLVKQVLLLECHQVGLCDKVEAVNRMVV